MKVWEDQRMVDDHNDDYAQRSPRKRDEREMHIGTPEHSSWSTFVHKFEQFTDVLCAAAQFGVDERLENRYVTLRGWFTEHYYHHTPRLRPHLDDEAARSQLNSAEATTYGRMDRFEAIFLPRSLNELLAHDDGNLISLVSDVSRAVYAVKE